MTTHQQSNSNDAMTMANDDHDDDVTMQLVRLRSQHNNMTMTSNVTKWCGGSAVSCNCDDCATHSSVLMMQRAAHAMRHGSAQCVRMSDDNDDMMMTITTT